MKRLASRRWRSSATGWRPSVRPCCGSRRRCPRLRMARPAAAPVPRPGRGAAGPCRARRASACHSAWRRLPDSADKALAAASTCRSCRFELGAAAPGRHARRTGGSRALPRCARRLRGACRAAGSGPAARRAARGRLPASSAASQSLTHHVHRPHLDAVPARVLHQLRRRIKTHRLAVEQRAQEGCGLVALEPGTGIGQQREAGRVAIRENRIRRSPGSA